MEDASWTTELVQFDGNVRGIVVLKLLPWDRFGSVPAPEALTSLSK